jgi:hypothetical protein
MLFWYRTLYGSVALTYTLTAALARFMDTARNAKVRINNIIDFMPFIGYDDDG